MFISSSYFCQALWFHSKDSFSTVSLLWLKNNGTKNPFPMDIFILADQNSFDKPFSHSNSQEVELCLWLALSRCKLIYIIEFISFSYYFSFHLCPNWAWNFGTKIFCYRSYPTITWHRTENVLLMKFEITGLVYLAIIEFSFCRTWRILQIKEGFLTEAEGG